MRTIEYKELFDNYLEYNSWKSDESFPIKGLDNHHLEKLNDYEIIEYVFEGMQSKRSQESFDKLISQFKHELLGILKNDSKGKFLVAIEHGSKQKTRIRSYKGLVDKENLKKEEFFQKEFLVSASESRIAFVAQLSEVNFPYLSRFFFDSSNSFIISSKQNYLKENFWLAILMCAFH